MTPATFVIIVLIVLVVVLAAVWFVATRVKRRIDDEAVVAVPVSRTVQATTACVERLRALSKEPVLLKLGDGVLRYQVDDRPMAPVAVAPGETAMALREVQTALVKEFGADWVALVRPTADDTLTVDRLR